MQEGLTEEDRQQVRVSIERFAAGHYTFEKRRTILRGPEASTAPTLRAMGDAGWLGLAVPVDHGGLGGNDADLGIVMEQVGSALMMEPFLSTAALCAPLLVALGASLDQPPFAGILEGTRVAALAHAEPRSGFARPVPATTASGPEPACRIDGSKCAVLDGAMADVLLVTAVDAAGHVGLHAVEATAPGVRRTAYMTVDERHVADVTFDKAVGHRVGHGHVAEALDLALDRATVAAGYEAVGAMSSLIDMTARYLKQRHQFGQPLASFQVLQHRLVDMFVALEESRATLDVACRTLGASRTEREGAVSAAKVLYARAARHVAQQAVQLHGGMGVTDELAVSHYFRRLTFLSTLFGDADFHLDRYCALGS
jgi:alkylation response protein AidB-like acyl-CoA dehydrogenase